MAPLDDALDSLRRNADELRSLGVKHSDVFGSVARGQARRASDVDVLVELDETAGLDLFDYINVKRRIAELLGGRVDVVNRSTLKPLMREQVLREAVRAF
jgi:predicted nucleotidyltransferase